MNRLWAVWIAIAVAVGWLQSASAQDEAVKAVPVEFFSCNYNEGKSSRDLKKVIDKFNRWADKHDSSYSAWTMTPQFHGGVDFDFGWMGSWPDGNAFGASQDQWMSDGSDLADAFTEVISCRSHELSTAVPVHTNDGEAQSGVILYVGCNLNDGKTTADAFEAHKSMAARMKEKGGNVESWLLFPGIGSVDTGYDYWQALVFGNYTEMGAAMERYNNGGGWRAAQEVLGSVVSCSSTSAWDARLVRSGS